MTKLVKQFRVATPVNQKNEQNMQEIAYQFANWERPSPELQLAKIVELLTPEAENDSKIPENNILDSSNSIKLNAFFQLYAEAELATMMNDTASSLAIYTNLIDQLSAYFNFEPTEKENFQSAKIEYEDHFSPKIHPFFVIFASPQTAKVFIFSGDIFTGGPGDDGFIWSSTSLSSLNAPDQVTNFKQAERGIYFTGEFDHLNFSDLNLELANFNYAHLRSEFSGIAGQLIWDGSSEPEKIILKIDVNGDGLGLYGADMEIILHGNFWLFGDEFQNVANISGGLFTSSSDHFSPGNNAANVFTINSILDFNLNEDTYFGGNGSDTLRLFNADNRNFDLDLSTVLNLSTKINNIEHIDLSSGINANTLILTAQNVLDITSSHHQLFIHGDSNDHVVIGNGWSSPSPVTIQGVAFNNYSQTVGATELNLYIESDIIHVTMS